MLLTAVLLCLVLSLACGQSETAEQPQLPAAPQAAFTGYHYAHAWALIYFVLYYADDAKVRKKTVKWFSDLFSLALKQRVTPKTVEDRLGGREKLKEFERRWKSWLKDLPYDFDPKKNK